MCVKCLPTCDAAVEFCVVGSKWCCSGMFASSIQIDALLSNRMEMQHKED